MSGAVKSAVLRRFRPAVGLGFCMTAMAIFGVVMFFFSPADLQALPPRQEVSGATSTQAATIAECSGQLP